MCEPAHHTVPGTFCSLPRAAENDDEMLVEMKLVQAGACCCSSTAGGLPGMGSFHRWKRESCLRAGVRAGHCAEPKPLWDAPWPALRCCRGGLRGKVFPALGLARERDVGAVLQGCPAGEPGLARAPRRAPTCTPLRLNFQTENCFASGV